MTIWRTVARRLLALPPTLAGVLVVTFILLQVIPGNPVDRLVGERGADPVVRERLRVAYGLDQPLPVRFGLYCRSLARGDFGTIPGTGRPVVDEFLDRLPNTLRLAMTAFLISLVVGVPTGILSALRPGTWLDAGIRTISTLCQATPVFWFGLMIMYVVALRLRLLPPSGDGSGSLAHLILPAVTLGLRPAAFLQRVVRSSLLEVLGQDYIRTARAKGLAETAVVIRHGLRNAAIPVVTVIGVDLGSLLSGSVITESIFQYRGLGSFILYGIQNRIYSIVMLSALSATLLFIIVNAATDVLYTLIDPRVQESA